MSSEGVSKRLPDIYPSLSVSPLVEIFAVTIEGSPDDFLKGNCEIYGSIFIVDDRDDLTFDIYDRDKDNPESISFGEPLLLTFSWDVEGAVIFPLHDIHLKVELYDRARLDMCVAKTSIDFDGKPSQLWLETYYDKFVPGENSVKAQVHYAIFPYAVAATVNVSFFSKDDHFDTFTNRDDFLGDSSWAMEGCGVEDITPYDKHDCSITAKLSAYISASGAIQRSDVNSPHRSSLLYRTPKEESMEVKSGEFINLSRSVVAVPGSSSLLIQASFNDGDTKLPIVSGNAIFKPTDNGKYKYDIVGDNGDRIRVQVSWSSAFDEFYRVTTRGSLGPSWLRIDGSNISKRQGLSPELPSSESTLSGKDTLREDQVSEISSYNCILPLIGFPNPVMELFSVVVCSKDGLPFKLYGSVKVDHITRCCIFEIEKSCPQECSNSGMLAIVGSCSSYSFSLLTNLAIHADFKDVSGAIISKGCVSFRGVNAYLVGEVPLFEVIRGERGFSAVHYSIFPDGVSAVVDVKLSRNSFPVTVKGEILATYAGSELRICYPEKLFRSTLFYNLQDGVTLNASDSTLPLVKSVVSLPRISYLIIEVDISVSQGDAKAAVALKHRVEFKCNNDSPWQIKVDDLDMVVSVDFSLP